MAKKHKEEQIYYPDNSQDNVAQTITELTPQEKEKFEAWQKQQAMANQPINAPQPNPLAYPSPYIVNNGQAQPLAYNPYVMGPVKPKKQETGYGTGAVICGLIAVALAALFFLYVEVLMGSSIANIDSVGAFFLWLFALLLLPLVSGIGSILCGLAGIILGIIAPCKAPKRAISWFGFVLGIIGGVIGIGFACVMFVGALAG